jgi:tripartite ATP-independent transporter DctP family solute receptor
MSLFSRRGLLAAPLILAAGCSDSAARRRVVRVGHDNPPSHPVHAGLETMAQVLSAGTSGSLRAQLFPSSQLGTQQEQILATAVGSQDLYLTGTGLLAQYYPPVAALEAPFVFAELANLYRAVAHPIGQKLLEGLRLKAGIRILDVWYLGRRHLTLTRGGATRPEELRGRKVRSATAPLYIETVKALGADPSPMGIGEVYLALKTGVIDGQENPLPTIDTMKFYEVAPHLVLTGHMITPLAVAINDRRWSRLEPAQQESLLSAVRAGREKNNRTILQKEESLLERFRGLGVEIVEADREAFRQAARQVAEHFAPQWGASTYEELRRVGEGESP